LGFSIGLYTTQWPVFLLYKLGDPGQVGLANGLISATAVLSYFVGAWMGNHFPKKPLFMLSWVVVLLLHCSGLLAAAIGLFTSVVRFLGS